MIHEATEKKKGEKFMRLKIERDVLLKHLKMVEKALPVRTPFPVLEGILLTVSEEKMLVRASDSDLTIEVTIPQVIDSKVVMTVEEEGAFVVFGKKFVELISKSKPGLISLTLTEKGLQIQSGRSKSILPGFQATDYPQLNVGDMPKSFEILPNDLSEIIRVVGPFTGSNESRPVLMGVNFVFGDGYLTTCATDSFRLSRHQVEMEEVAETFNVVIPYKALKEAAKTIESETDKLILKASMNQVLLQTSKATILMRLIDGIYPDTKQFVPETFQWEYCTDRKELIEALERAALLSSDATNRVVKMVLKAGTNILLLTSLDKTLGDIEEELTLNQEVTSSLTVGASTTFLKDALNTLSSDTVSLKFNGDMSPFVIAEPDNKMSLRLIVPVRLMD